MANSVLSTYGSFLVAFHFFSQISEVKRIQQGTYLNFQKQSFFPLPTLFQILPYFSRLIYCPSAKVLFPSAQFPWLCFTLKLGDQRGGNTGVKVSLLSVSSSGTRKWCLIAGLPQVEDHFDNVFLPGCCPLSLDGNHAKTEATCFK